MTRRTSFVAAGVALLLLLAIAFGTWLVMPGPAPEESAADDAGQATRAEDVAGTPAAPAEPAETRESPPAASPPAGTAPEPQPQQAALPPAGTASPAGTAVPEAKEEPDRPSFDVVRVERSGEAVIAGRAAPGAEVTVTSDGQEIGKTEADARGEWVFLPDRPLPSGDHELGLVSRDASGKEAQSEQVVVVSLPETAKPETEKPDTEKADTEKKEEAGEKQAGQVRAGPDQAGAEQVGEGSAPGQESAAPLAVSLPRSGEGEARVLQGGGSGIAVGDFVLESILYDETGRLTVGGRVPPEGRVFTYIDQGFVGEAEGDSDGRWVLAASEPIAVGLHRLRVDHVDETGKVLARIETPFARSQLIANLPDRDRFVVVQPGNSLWRIARRVYGKGLQYGVIFDANRDQIRDPDLIYPGQIFSVPNGG